MPDMDSIGIVEVSSIALGYQVEDAMLKTAQVSLLMARTVCPGKFLVGVGGEVAQVQASVQAGASMAQGGLISQGVIARVHPGLFPAIGQSVQLDPATCKALGVIETFSASSIIAAADAAAKAADITLFRVHLAMAVGGKGFCLMTGDTASVEAAVEAGSVSAAKEGMLVAKTVISAPAPDLFKEYI